MKKTLLLAVLSLLLCLTLSLVSCEDKLPGFNKTETEPETEIEMDVQIEPETSATVSVAPERDNFFHMEFEYDAPYVLTALTTNYGEYLPGASTENLLVFLKETKDYMNNLQQFYTIFSVKEMKVVKTIVHSFEDNDYSIPDDFGNPRAPEKEIDVLALTLEDEVDYLIVKHTTNTRLDDAVIEDNKLSDSYAHEYSYDFYDAQGTLITTTRMTGRATVLMEGDTVISASFGSVVAHFSIKENKLISTYDGETSALKNTNYTFENNKYVYHVSVPFGSVDYGDVLGFYGTLEVYSKATGNLVCTYEHTDFATFSLVSLLSNGNVLIQNISETDIIDFDYFNYDSKVEFASFVLDVKTGAITEVDFPYLLLMGTYTPEDFIASLDPDYYGKVTLTENVRNIAYGLKVVDGTLAHTSYDLVFFDNELNVNYVEGKYCDEQAPDAEIKILPNGYMAVEVNTGFASYAMMKDGKIVAYAPVGAMVTDYAIITDMAIFDHSMNLVFSFNSDEHLDYIGTLGKYFIYYTYEERIIESDTTTDDPYYGGDDGEETTSEPETETILVVRVLDTSNGSWNHYYDTSVREITEDYIVLCEEYLGEYEYSLKNVEFNTVANSKNPIDIQELGDSYLVTLMENGNDYVFLFSAQTVQVNEYESGYEH